MWLNPTHLVQSGGLLLIGLIIFAESGVLVGFFLPGDTLLFTAGFFAAQGKLPLLPLLVIVVLAAALGDNAGYEIGKRLGPRLFNKKDGLLFRREYIVKAHAFYEQHGGKTILFARFLPLIRTLAPMIAGSSTMPRRRFILFNFIGAALWGMGVALAGVLLGKKIPNIDRYLLPAVIVAMLVVFAPTLYHVAKTMLKNRRKNKKAAVD